MNRQAFQLAVMAPSASIKIPTLQTVTFDCDANRLPKIWSGAFAVVFRCASKDGRLAVRCSVGGMPREERQYAVVRDYIRLHRPDYLLAFEHYPAGILVDGKLRPVTVSRWVPGVDLRTFILDHRGANFLPLLQTWRTVERQMGAAGIAHGDLHHDNIIVTGEPRNPKITLIDYDSFVVPANIGEPESIFGIEHYQHPQRIAGAVSKKSDKVDGFSMLVVNLALEVLVASESTWHKFAANSDGLYLDGDDLRQPKQSSALMAADRLKGRPAQLARQIREALEKPPLHVGRSIQSVSTFSTLNQPGGRPSWMQLQSNALATVRPSRPTASSNDKAGAAPLAWLPATPTPAPPPPPPPPAQAPPTISHPVEAPNSPSDGNTWLYLVAALIAALVATGWFLASGF